MHRKHIRASVSGADVDIPITNFVDGQFVLFQGGSLVTASAVRGPSTSGLNQVAVWADLTGTLLDAVTVTISAGDITNVDTINTRDPDQWAAGPIGGVQDNAIARWDGTNGRLLQNSFVYIDDNGNITGVNTINGNYPDFWVEGPGGGFSTDEAIARWDGTTGRLLQNSVVTLSNSGALAGATTLNGKTISRLTIGPISGTSISGHLAGWLTTNGVELYDTGKTANNLVQCFDASSVDGYIAMFSGGDPHIITNYASIRYFSGNLSGLTYISGRTIANFVDGPSSATDNAVARFDGTTGKLIQNSAVFISDPGAITGVASINGKSIDWGDVSGPASSTDNAVARFNSTTGKLIQNGVVAIDDSGNITGAGTYNTIDIAAHASRHYPAGADSILNSDVNNGDVVVKSANNAPLTGVVIACDNTRPHNGVTSTPVIATSWIMIAAGNYIMNAAIPYALSDTGGNLVIQVGWTSGSGYATVSCGPGAGHIQTSDDTGLLPTSQIPAAGVIYVNLHVASLAASGNFYVFMWKDSGASFDMFSGTVTVMEQTTTPHT